jgi:hypothetical protein
VRPYTETLEEADRVIAWGRVSGLALFAVLLAQGVHTYGRMSRAPLHIDMHTVAELPAERLRSVTPDVIDATGFAREAAERLLSMNPATIADDQAWILNRSIPPLAEAYAKEVPRIIGMVRQVREGEVRARVRAVTALHGQVPFRMEAVVVQEFLGDFKAPGRGKADPNDPRKEEVRITFTLVRTAKSHLNRDALLIREWAMATTR